MGKDLQPKVSGTNFATSEYHPMGPINPWTNEKITHDQPLATKTRRDFLEIFAVGTALTTLAAAESAVANAFPFIKGSPTRPVWEQLATGTVGADVEELRRSVEQRFGIQFLNPDTGMLAASLKGEVYPTCFWDAPRLETVRRSLSILPSHFYAPREDSDGKKKPILLALVDIPTAKLLENKVVVAECQCAEPNNQTIVFDRSSLPAVWGFGSQASAMLAHELVHTLTTPEIGSFAAKICGELEWGGLGIRQLFQSEITTHPLAMETWTNLLNLNWWDKNITNLPNGRIVFKNPHQYVRIHPQVLVPAELYYLFGKYLFISRLESILLANPKVLGEKGDDYLLSPNNGIRNNNASPDLESYTSHLGYGARTMHEFISVASEIYLQGKPTFLGQYGVFMGSRVAENLYQRIKKEIYQGIEYPSA